MSVIVLCELAWVLTSAYEAAGEEVARVIDQVLRTRQLQVQRRDQVRAALAQYKEASVRGGFSRLLGRLGISYKRGLSANAEPGSGLRRKAPIRHRAA